MGVQNGGVVGSGVGLSERGCVWSSSQPPLRDCHGAARKRQATARPGLNATHENNVSDVTSCLIVVTIVGLGDWRSPPDRDRRVYS